jgi:patatin-like phospholipase/acyl hydrolase
MRVLDGGGIRGLFAIIILQQVMEEVRKLDCPDNPEGLRPCDYFDIIGGTSTGGSVPVLFKVQLQLADKHFLAYLVLCLDVWFV